MKDKGRICSVLTTEGDPIEAEAVGLRRLVVKQRTLCHLDTF